MATLPRRHHEPTTHRAALAGLGISTLCWAAAFILGKTALAEMSPLAVGTWRYAVALAVLIPVALRSAMRARAARLDAPEEPALPFAPPDLSPPAGIAFPLAVMVVTGGVLYPWLFLDALRRTSATNTSLLIALNPLITLLFAPLVGEALERRQRLGAALAFCGAVVVISHGDPSRIAALELNTGDLLAVTAAACWACFNLASRPVVARLAPSIANCTVYAGGFVALFALAEDPVGELARVTPAVLAGVALMALLSSVVAGQLFLVGVRVVGVGRAVLFVYLVPVLTAVLSAALLDEALVPAQLAGGLAVLSGLGLATSRPAAPAVAPARDAGLRRASSPHHEQPASDIA